MTMENKSLMILYPKYLVPAVEERHLRANAMIAATNRAFDMGVLKNNGAQCLTRDIRPEIDFPATFPCGDRWIFPSPAQAIPAVCATTTWISECISPSNIMVFYGIGFETDNPEIGTILFSNFAGCKIAFYNFESYRNQRETTFFFSRPIVYNNDIKIDVINRIPIPATGIFMRLFGYVIGPLIQMEKKA